MAKKPIIEDDGFIEDGFVEDSDDGFVEDGFVSDSQPVQTQQDKSFGGMIRSFFNKAKESFLPPTSLDAAKRFLNPVAGKYGIGAALEEVGQNVSDVARKSAENILTDNPLARKAPTLNAAAALIPAVGMDLLPNLTPSDMQAQLGAEGLGPVVRGTSQAISQATKAFGATPEAVKAMQAGVPLTPAEITRSKPLSLVESTLEKIPFSSGTIQKFRDKQASRLTRLADDIIEQMGTKQSPEIVGANVQDAIKAKEASRFKGAQKLFNRRDQYLTGSNQILPTTTIPTSRLSEKARQLLEAENQLSAGVRNQKISSLLEDIAKYREQGISGAGAKALRERLNSFINDTPSGLGGTAESNIYRQLKSALDEDIVSFSQATGGDLEKIQKAANQFYKKQKELFKDDTTVKRIVESDPEKVINLVFRPDGVTPIKTVKKAAGEKAFKQLKQRFVNKLFDGSLNQPAGDALRKNLHKYGDEVLNEVFSKDELGALKEFGEISNVAKTAEKLAGNPSGTAQVLISYDQGVYFLKHPIRGTLLGVPAYVLAKMYLNPLTRKMVAKGFSTPVTSPTSAELMSKLAVAAKGFMREQE